MASLVLITLSLLTSIYARPQTFEKVLVTEDEEISLKFVLDEEQKTIRYISTGERILATNVTEDYNVGVYADRVVGMCYIDILRRNYQTEAEFLKTSGERIRKEDIPAPIESLTNKLKISNEIVLHCEGACRCIGHSTSLTSVEDCSANNCGHGAKCRDKATRNDDEFGSECYCSETWIGNPYSRCYDPSTPELCSEICSSPCVGCPQYPQCLCSNEEGRPSASNVPPSISEVPESSETTPEEISVQNSSPEDLPEEELDF